MNKDKQEEYIARKFNRNARGYDESRLVKSYQRRTQALVIDKIKFEKGMNILDLGCGTGWGILESASKLEGTGKVIGLDLSEVMIEQARQKLAEFDYPSVEFRVGSGSSLDYESYFDCVFTTNAFHHFNRKEEIFFNVWKSLRENGIFIVQDICDDYFLMRLLDFTGRIGERAHAGSITSEGLRKLLISTDFKNVEVERVNLNWLWEVMIGKGSKQVAVSKTNIFSSI